MEIVTDLKKLKFISGTAVTVGKFDGLHAGHVLLLSHVTHEAQNRSLTPVVVTIEHVYPDAQAPLMSDDEKEAMLTDLGIAFWVRLPLQTVKDMAADAFVKTVLVDGLNVRYLVCGDDFRFGKERTGDVLLLQAAAAKFGFEFEAIRRLRDRNGNDISSNAIREALRTGDAVSAFTMLMRPYTLSGTVVRGRELARKLGFPTANVDLDPGQFLPKYGVYVVYSEIDGEQLFGIANLGVRPTVGGTAVVLEIHYPDFHSTLYARQIRASLLTYVRPEVRFDSIFELRDQIASDVRFLKEWKERSVKTLPNGKIALDLSDES